MMAITKSEGTTSFLDQFFRSVLNSSIDTPLNELERMHQFLRQSADLVLQVIKVKQTLDASLISSSPTPPIQIMQYQLQSESPPVHPPSPPPSQPLPPILSLPSSSPSPLPPAPLMTYDQLQFGDMTPQILHEFTCPVLVHEPTRKTLRDAYMYIAVYDRITLKTYKPRQKHSGLTPTLGIRGEFRGFVLGGEAFTTVVWNDQIAKLLGISAEDLVTKTDNLSLLELKLDSLYAGHPLAISVTYRVYQQQFTSSADSIGCLSWDLVHQNVLGLEDDTPISQVEPPTSHKKQRGAP